MVERIYIHYKGYKSLYDEWLTVHDGHPDLHRIKLINTESIPTEPHSTNDMEMKLNIGDPLDVKDTSEKWYNASVIDIDHQHDMIKVNYTSWSNKYDEVYIIHIMIHNVIIVFLMLSLIFISSCFLLHFSVNFIYFVFSLLLVDQCGVVSFSPIWYPCNC